MPLNFIAIQGNLTRDTEIHRGASCSVVSGCVAVSESFVKDGERKETTSFIDWKMFRKDADKYVMAKGVPVTIVGALKQETWTDKATGAKRSKVVVVAERVIRLDVMEQDKPAKPASSAKKDAEPDRAAPASSATLGFDSQEIPF